MVKLRGLKRTLREFLSAANSITPTGNAATCHKSVAGALVARGFRVRIEVAVVREGAPPEEPALGYIDLKAEKRDLVIACEIDRASPRQRSLAKLKACWWADARVVLLRKGTPEDRPDGILVRRIRECW